MQTGLLTALLLSAAAFLGVPAAVLPERREADTPSCPTPTPVFQASNYRWGCSPGGCSNSFNLTAVAGYLPGAPAFNVICNGIFVQQPWRTCWNPDGSTLDPANTVQTIWKNGPDRERQYHGAAHIYRQADGSWVNATGYTDFLPQQGMSFAFPVTIIGTREGT